MKKFDYSFLLKDNIPSNIVSLLVAIEKTAIESNLYQEIYPVVFNNLQDIAIVQSVKASNAIEGIITTDKRIKAIVSQNVAPINHDEEEIAGYRDVLNTIHNDHAIYQMNEKDILEFHQQLIGYTGFSYGGKYKTEDNVIMETDKDGKRTVRFRPTKAIDTKESMEQLILAYMESRDNSNISRLLLIPCIILDFLCIHPFSDGNGRLSRLLSLFLLYKNNYDVGKYISFENIINTTKADYYHTLRLSSNDWHNNGNDYYPFIESFLKTLLTCYTDLNNRFEMINNKKLNKKSRIKEMIMSSRYPVSRKEIYEMWPDISQDTIKNVIKQLQKEDIIIKIGNFKDAKYQKKQ